MQLWSESLPGDASTRAALYGPLVLAADLGPGPKDGPLKIGGYDTGPKHAELPAPVPNPIAQADEAGEWMDVVSAKDLSFKSRGANAIAVKPMYRITDEKYAVYWAMEKKA
jgi:hypothetical protein